MQVYYPHRLLALATYLETKVDPAHFSLAHWANPAMAAVTKERRKGQSLAAMELWVNREDSTDPEFWCSACACGYLALLDPEYFSIDVLVDWDQETTQLIYHPPGSTDIVQGLDGVTEYFGMYGADRYENFDTLFQATSEYYDQNNPPSPRDVARNIRERLAEG